MRTAIAAIALLLLAGCGAPARPPDDGIPVAPEDWSERALAGEHDHQDAALHANLSTSNFAIVAHDPLVSPSLGRTPGGHHCGDAKSVAGGRRLAALEMRNVGGFLLVDVTKPAEPKVLGEFVMRHSRVYDLDVVPDGRHVILVTTSDTPSIRPGAAPALEWRSACASSITLPPPPGLVTPEDPVPRPSSIILVNIEDPAAPRIVDQRPIPSSGHSVFSTVIDGRTLVLVSVYFPTGPNGYYQFYEVLTGPLGTRLEFLSAWEMPFARPTTGGTLEHTQVHDGWIAIHPVTRKPVAVLSGGREVHFVDATDPRMPRLLAEWTDWSPARAGFSGSFHSAYAMPELWNGTHYTIIGPEFSNKPAPQPSGTVWVLDTTDPTKPRAVAGWTLPHDVTWSGAFMFSNHYYAVQNRTLFVSMYHGGVWAIDLSGLRPDGFTLLPSVGVFLADRVSPKPAEKNLRWTPTHQEVFSFPDGTLASFDGFTGLYTLRYDHARPAPAPDPYPVAPP